MKGKFPSAGQTSENKTEKILLKREGIEVLCGARPVRENGRFLKGTPLPGGCSYVGVGKKVLQSREPPDQEKRQSLGGVTIKTSCHHKARSLSSNRKKKLRPIKPLPKGTAQSINNSSVTGSSLKEININTKRGGPYKWVVEGKSYLGGEGDEAFRQARKGGKSSRGGKKKSSFNPPSKQGEKRV